MLKITEQLQKKEATAEAHKDVVQAFLARFRLHPNEMAVHLIILLQLLLLCCDIQVILI